MTNPANLPQPNQTALIIIDMQNDYVHREGASLRFFRAKQDGRDLGPAEGPSAAEQIVPQLLRFIRAARQVRVPLVWVRTINDAATESPAALAQGKRFAWADDAWGTAFFASLEPQPGEPVITKRRHSAFFGTELELILGRLGVQTVILTGVSTPYCVESTARDAFARDYQVITLADCTASRVWVEHEESLARLGRVFGQVATSAEIMRGWNLVIARP